MSATWTAVVPVKAWRIAKSRLGTSAADRIDFARAVALDTLDAVAASPLIARIVVVTREPELCAIATRLASAVVLPEPITGSPDRLNDAIRHGRNWALAQAPTAPVVVIPADLAALTTAALDATLGQLARFGRAHVPDHGGSGTTLSAAARPDLLEPHYGPASERCHAAAGSVPIVHVAPGARLDVDDLDDLAGATSIGLGRRTRAMTLLRADRAEYLQKFPVRSSRYGV